MFCNKFCLCILKENMLFLHSESKCLVLHTELYKCSCLHASICSLLTELLLTHPLSLQYFSDIMMVQLRIKVMRHWVRCFKCSGSSIGSFLWVLSNFIKKFYCVVMTWHFEKLVILRKLDWIEFSKWYWEFGVVFLYCWNVSLSARK